MDEFSASIGVGEDSIHVSSAGEGTPLYLLNGLGYAHWSWESISGLSRRFQVVMAENRGTGRSSTPPGPYSVEAMAGDHIAVIDRLGLSPVHLLGFSMGGYIAITLALARPDLVASLILVGTSPGGHEHDPTPAATLDAWMEAADLEPADFARQTMHFSFSPGWTDRHPLEFDQLLQARLEHPTEPEAWASQFQACETYLSRGAPVEELECPVLVLHGEVDRVVPKANGIALSQRTAGAKLSVFDGAGHLCFIEQPSEFMSAVDDHLLDVTSHRPRST